VWISEPLELGWISKWRNFIDCYLALNMTIDKPCFKLRSRIYHFHTLMEMKNLGSFYMDNEVIVFYSYFAFLFWRIQSFVMWCCARNLAEQEQAVSSKCWQISTRLHGVTSDILLFKLPSLLTSSLIPDVLVFISSIKLFISFYV